MADFTLECPKCGQQTTFSGLDEAPRGVLCGQCGESAVLGEPGARERSEDADGSSWSAPTPDDGLGEREE